MLLEKGYTCNLLDVQCGYEKNSGKKRGDPEFIERIALGSGKTGAGTAVNTAAYGRSYAVLGGNKGWIVNAFDTQGKICLGYFEVGKNALKDSRHFSYAK